LDNSLSVRLTLVSGSPRRRELLAQFGLPFDIEPSGATEHWALKDSRMLAEDNARRKVVGSPHYRDRSRLLLGADTIVVLNGRVFGKPMGEESARRMLSALSGREHHVITGVYLSGPGPLPDTPPLELPASELSKVHFRPLTSHEIDSYLASGEWQGKAGAYAIQETGGGLVAALEGDFDNVVGLPIKLIHELFSQHFAHCRFL
jgi:septum formation protein